METPDNGNFLPFNGNPYPFIENPLSFMETFFRESGFPSMVSWCTSTYNGYKSSICDLLSF